MRSTFTSLYSNPKGQVPTKWKIIIRPSLDLKLKPFFSGIFVKSLTVTCVSLILFCQRKHKKSVPVSTKKGYFQINRKYNSSNKLGFWRQSLDINLLYGVAGGSSALTPGQLLKERLSNTFKSVFEKRKRNQSCQTYLY